MSLRPIVRRNASVLVFLLLLTGGTAHAAEAITVSAVPDTKPYDGTTRSSAVPIITSGELAPGDTADFTQSFDTSDAGTAKTLIPSGSINSTGGVNYEVTFENDTTGFIVPADLTVTAKDTSKTYGDADPSFEYAITAGRLASGDSVSGSLTRSGGENAGDYLITDSGTFSAGSNYTLTFNSGTFIIAPKSVTGVITVADKVYDGTRSATMLTRSLDGMLSDDISEVTLVGGTASFDTKNAGTNKTVTGSGFALVGSADGNYTLSNPAITTQASITVADQTITFDTIPDTSYGTDVRLHADASSGLPLALAASGSCTLDGTTVHLMGLGQCTITAEQDGDENYNPAPEAAQTFTIFDGTPPVIALTGNAAISIRSGTAFTDPGATATDDIDGTVAVTVGGAVDVTKTGTYVLTYDASDAAGNASQVTRTVTVFHTVQRTGGGGGGGGGSSNAPTINTASPAPTAGQVLGAAVFNFSTDLHAGSTGDGVTELQKILITAGYLHVDAPTGWFGPLTQAAVKLYQAAHSIITTGYVGPLTREALNIGT